MSSPGKKFPTVPKKTFDVLDRVGPIASASHSQTGSAHHAQSEKSDSVFGAWRRRLVLRRWHRAGPAGRTCPPAAAAAGPAQHVLRRRRGHSRQILSGEPVTDLALTVLDQDAARHPELLPDRGRSGYGASAHHQ